MPFHKLNLKKNKKKKKMRHLLKLSLLLLFFLITGCATVPPLTHDLKSQETYDATFGGVWDPVVSYFNKKNIPIRIIDPTLGIIESAEIKISYEGFTYQSDFSDCGTLGGLYVYHGILGKFIVFVKKQNDDETSVQVNADYKASLWLGNNFKGWVTCQSKGYFEQNLFEFLNSNVTVHKTEIETTPPGEEKILMDEKSKTGSQPVVQVVTKKRLGLPTLNKDLFRKIVCEAPEKKYK